MAKIKKQGLDQSLPSKHSCNWTKKIKIVCASNNVQSLNLINLYNFPHHSWPHQESKDNHATCQTH